VAREFSRLHGQILRPRPRILPSWSHGKSDGTAGESSLGTHCAAVGRVDHAAFGGQAETMSRPVLQSISTLHCEFR